MHKKTGPTTTREALIAEMLGDMTALLDRFEALPAITAASEDQIKLSAAALADAGDKYRLAVTAFTEQAKAELSDYLDRQTARTAEEQRAAMQEAARLAFRGEASDKAAYLSAALADAVKEFKRSKWDRLTEHAITAIVASSISSIVLYVLFRGSI